MATFSRSLNPITFNVVRHGKLYFLEDEHDNASIPTYITRTLEEWHSALGHMGKDDILQLPNRTRVMNILKPITSKPCMNCHESKPTSGQFQNILRNNQIKQTFTAPHTLYQNSKSERV